MTQRRSELLMPAGSLTTLKTAVLYGADAIYMGTPDMSLRSKSKMTLEEVVEGIEFAHSHGVRVYLTLNLFAHNKDIARLPEYLDTIRSVKPDGLIVADPGVFSFVRENAPEIPLHISTQANVCSFLTVDYWHKQGAELVVLAREVSFAELEEIREKCPDVKLEAFVHGAMCMTYSGRCLLSNYMAERGANQGACANSCRWNYKVHIKLKDGTLKELEINDDNLDMFEFFLEEGYRPGDFLPIEEDERGSYILNAKDLCLMPKLDDYLRIGVDSLKVEGRGRSPYYVAVNARAYRHAIDDYYANPDDWDARPYMRELETVGNRGFSLAFHNGRLTNYAHNYEDTHSLAEWEYAGSICEVRDEAFVMEVKNKLEAGDVLEFVPPRSRETVLLRLYEFTLENGKTVEAVHAGQKQKIVIPFSAFDHEDPEKLRAALPELTIIRKEKALSAAEWARLKLDRTANRREQDQGSEKAYETNRKNLSVALEEKLMDRSPRSPRLGTEGCCGKGCNGCAVFWYDPEYAKAREVLAKKKIGEMFDRDMRAAE
ncbi:MAG: U32 family peptidase C-terminal domain-containing protein [Rhodospirillales bacterium]|nr:U32 family peptidase C-terminal domain-containing protein [Rhodospirillales bacterium]